MILADSKSSEVTEIINMIYREIGIDAHSIGQSAFDSAISLRMDKIGHKVLSDYIALLITSHNELTRLVEEIIVPETWFFRDNAAFDALVKHCRHRSGELFRILSLPSSSGEEAYSIAMTLLEAGFSSDQFSIDAFDISQKNITAAMKGIYRDNSFRKNMPEHMKLKYFTENNDKYCIKDEVKQSVNFMAGNLFAADMLATPAVYDVVFCKNLFIYFNSEKKKISFNKISNALKNNGLLFIGHSECGIIPDELFSPCEISSSFGFIKRSKNHLFKKRNNISIANTYATHLKQQKQVKPVARNTTSKPVKQLTKATKDNIQPALDYANSGQLEKALQACSQVNEDDKNADYYALLATIYSAQKKYDNAEKNYRKALFLEPAHIEALTHLTLLLEQKGDTNSATLLKTRLGKATAK